MMFTCWNMLPPRAWKRMPFHRMPSLGKNVDPHLASIVSRPTGIQKACERNQRKLASSDAAIIRISLFMCTCHLPCGWVGVSLFAGSGSFGLLYYYNKQTTHHWIPLLGTTLLWQANQWKKHIKAHPQTDDWLDGITIHTGWILSFSPCNTSQDS